MRSLCVAAISLIAGLLAASPLAAQRFENVPQAQEPAATSAAPGAKIGIINVQLAMARTQEGQKASEELQARFTPKQQDLAKLQDEIRNLEDQLRSQERTLSPEAFQQLARDLEQKRKQATRLQQDLQEEVEDAQAEVINKIGEKMQQIIDRYARENKLDVIFNVSPGGSIIYATPGVNITEAIVQLYDQTHPVQRAGGGASQPPGTRQNR